MKLTKKIILGLLAPASLLLSLLIADPSQAAPISIVNQVQGRTPFIWNVTLNGINTSALQSVQFSIRPKTGSLTQPISATYSATYLSSQNRINSGLGQVTISVFGLYASLQTNSNSVTFTIRGRQSNSTLLDTITTTPWTVTPYSSPTKVVSRNNVKLDYSFYYLREFAGDGFSPVLIDTDGEVRWIGTVGCNSNSASVKFYQSTFYTNCGTTLYQNNLDGSSGPLFDYSSPNSPVNASWLGHHNYDIGKQGLLLEINAYSNGNVPPNTNLEQEIIEVSPTTGQVYKTFDFGRIISQAMTAGGDNPALFVKDPNNDWFHNNSATYWPSTNEIVASSRENFVIAVDYTTQKIKWILGDPTKPWYTNFPSLRKLALKFAPGTTYPVGQHALSITNNNQLLLFDNDLYGGGGAGLNPNPPYSVPRMYSINESRGIATETWQFLRAQALWSPICSSIYQDGRSFLVDYASQGLPWWGSPVGNGLGYGPEVMGLDGNKQVAFDYYYPGDYSHGWNADPIHLENLQFISSAPILPNLAAPLQLAPIDTGILPSLYW